MICSMMHNIQDSLPHQQHSKILPVILAGGFGERLWPLSRTAYPKQFINLLTQEHSLFQRTIQRIPENAKFLAPLIICHTDYRFVVAKQLQEINKLATAIILEPVSKNTAPAIAVAALYAKKHYPNCRLLILPADHFILDETKLLQSILSACDSDVDSQLTTFGIQPNHPATGYGYIQSDANNNITKFIEKPDLATASKIYNESSFYWNSGIFLFNPTTILEELNNFTPEIISSCHLALNNSKQDLDFIRLDASYSNCPAISIDYAVMEKTQYAKVYPINCGWSDVGNWSAVWAQRIKDSDGNTTKGQVVTHDTTNCLIQAEHRLVATNNISDLIIVETSDAVLVSHKDHDQQIRQLIKKVKDEYSHIVNENRKVMRPWGWYDCLANGPGFQVKHLYVQTGKSLSLQSHQYRSEHWIVVSGHAKVVREQEIIYLIENQSTFIPQNTKHQLINYGDNPLHVIEVQSGSYLGEDDIIRYADEHGRVLNNINAN